MAEACDQGSGRPSKPINQMITLLSGYLEREGFEIPQAKGAELLQALGRILSLDARVKKDLFDEAELKDFSDHMVIDLMKYAMDLVAQGHLLEAIPPMTLVREVHYNRLDSSDDIQRFYLRLYLLGSSESALASLHEKVGSLQRALVFFQRSVTVFMKICKELNPDQYGKEFLKEMDNLSRVYQALGDFRKAEDLLIQSVKLRKHIYGVNHPEAGRYLRNLANLYSSTGDLQKSKRYYESALQSFKETLGEDDVEIAITLSDASAIYKKDTSQAIIYMERALKIFRKQLKPDHPQVIAASSSLAALYSDASRTTESRKLLEEVWSIQEQTRGSKRAEHANVLNGLALVAQRDGDLEQAERLFVQAITIWKETCGSYHLAVASGLNNLAELYVSKQSYSKAFRSFMQSLEIHYVNAKHKLNVAAVVDRKIVSLLDLSIRTYRFLSLVMRHASNEDEVRNGFEWAVRCKGALLDEQSRINEIIRCELSENTKTDRDARLALFTQLVNYIVAGPEKLRLNAETFEREVSRLNSQIAQIEDRLLKASNAFGRQCTNRSLEVQDVLKNVPSDTAVIEYLSIVDFVDEDSANPALRTFAFIITPYQAVRLIDLGLTLVLNEQVRLARIAIDAELDSFQADNPQVHNNLYDSTSEALRNLYKTVWEPVEAVYGQAARVFICPDQQLNLVPFAALLDGDGRFLIQKCSLAYLTSGKELAAKTKGGSLSEMDFLGMANPNYDWTDRRLGKLPSLPKTQCEIESILPMIEGRREKTIFVGRSATKKALLMAKKPRILHLATHGYFLQDDTSTKDGTDPSIASRDPLLLSGLVFSKEKNNRSPTDENDDGDAHLTALEVTGMDFSMCDLVALSACHSGVGLPRLGAGVFGLRRAFSLAGARSLLMSLWAISEEDTPNQIKTFYDFLRKESPANALRKAQLDTIELLTKEIGYAPVGLWAPFIVQGASVFERFQQPSG